MMVHYVKFLGWVIDVLEVWAKKVIRHRFRCVSRK